LFWRRFAIRYGEEACPRSGIPGLQSWAFLARPPCSAADLPAPSFFSDCWREVWL